MTQSQRAKGSRGRGPTLAKDINRRRVYQLIKQKRNTSRVEVARLLHLNKNTVNSIVDEMLAHDFVLEFGPQTTNASGRKPIMLGFNAAVRWSVGAQLTSTAVQWAVTDLYAKPLTSFTVPLDAPTPDHVIAALLTGIDRVSAEYPLADCVGLCIGLPGLIDAASGNVITSSHLGWHHVPFLAMLKERMNTRIRVRLDNSVKLASLGEQWHGAGQGLDHFIYCNFGNGVGCSIMIGGAIVRGDRNAAGELGHIIVDPHGPLCRCGNSGCLEAWVSLPSILRRIGERTGLPVASLSLDWPLSELAAGNEAVVQELDQAGRHIGKALSYMTNLLNPKLIICDGPLMQAWAHLLPVIREELRLRCMAIMVDELLLARSALFPLTSCIGAAASVIQSWEEELISFEPLT